MVVSADPPVRRVTGALLEEVLPGLVAGCGSSSEEGLRCRESLEVLREVEEVRQERGGGGTSYTPSSSPPLQVKDNTASAASTPTHPYPLRLMPHMPLVPLISAQGTSHLAHPSTPTITQATTPARPPK